MMKFSRRLVYYVAILVGLDVFGRSEALIEQCSNMTKAAVAVSVIAVATALNLKTSMKIVVLTLAAIGAAVLFAKVLEDKYPDHTRLGKAALSNAQGQVATAFDVASTKVSELTAAAKEHLEKQNAELQRANMRSSSSVVGDARVLQAA